MNCAVLCCRLYFAHKCTVFFWHCASKFNVHISRTGLRSPGTVLLFLLRSHVVECTQMLCVLKCTELSSVYMLSNVQYCAFKCNMLSSVQYNALKYSTAISGFCDLRWLVPKFTMLYCTHKCTVLFGYYSLKCAVRVLSSKCAVSRVLRFECDMSLCFTKSTEYTVISYAPIAYIIYIFL